jgi:hypothetical protein
LKHHEDFIARIDDPIIRDLVRVIDAFFTNKVCTGFFWRNDLADPIRTNSHDSIVVLRWFRQSLAKPTRYVWSEGASGRQFNELLGEKPPSAGAIASARSTIVRGQKTGHRELCATMTKTCVLFDKFAIEEFVSSPLLGQTQEIPLRRWTWELAWPCGTHDRMLLSRDKLRNEMFKVP